MAKISASHAITILSDLSDLQIRVILILLSQRDIEKPKDRAEGEKLLRSLVLAASRLYINDKESISNLTSVLLSLLYPKEDMVGIPEK